MKKLASAEVRATSMILDEQAMFAVDGGAPPSGYQGGYYSKPTSSSGTTQGQGYTGGQPTQQVNREWNFAERGDKGYYAGSGSVTSGKPQYETTPSGQSAEFFGK
jgi:hypothetical protein